MKSCLVAYTASSRQAIKSEFSFIIGAVVLRENPYSEGSLPSLINSIDCDGTEEILTDCMKDQPARSCRRYEDAGVICQGKVTLRH